jgi:hypothetical protein
MLQGNLNRTKNRTSKRTPSQSSSAILSRKSIIRRVRSPQRQVYHTDLVHHYRATYGIEEVVAVCTAYATRFAVAMRRVAGLLNDVNVPPFPAEEALVEPQGSTSASSAGNGGMSRSPATRRTTYGIEERTTENERVN